MYLRFKDFIQQVDGGISIGSYRQFWLQFTCRVPHDGCQVDDCQIIIFFKDLIDRLIISNISFTKLESLVIPDLESMIFHHTLDYQGKPPDSHFGSIALSGSIPHTLLPPLPGQYFSLLYPVCLTCLFDLYQFLSINRKSNCAILARQYVQASLDASG